jgi:membrane-bound metal-dependent hydrolase YbcI (DUF457 family)
MPDASTHETVGTHAGLWGGGGLGAYHYLTPHTAPLLEGISVLELPLVALTVWAATRLGSRLPDLIEPSDDPNHRGFAHSIAAYLLTLGKVAWLWIGVSLGSAGGPWAYARLFLAFAGIAYLSHLHLDAHSPKSIPWLSH